jgi:hypothetical protein
MAFISRKDDEVFDSDPRDVLAQIMREGDISPNTMMECLYYSAEPDLWAVIRAVARLDGAARLQVMSYARKLSEEHMPSH